MTKRTSPAKLCAWSLASMLLQAQPVDIQPLSVVRDKIVIPDLTPENKQLLAQQAQVFIRDMYVHRYHKPLYYFWQLDPAIPMEEIVKHATSLQTKDLEMAIYKLFCKQRDLHLNYLFPEPQSLYRSTLPLTFERTAGPGNYFEVRVCAVAKELFEKFAPNQRVPALGDRVVSYNGKSVYAELLRLSPLSQGANLFGGFTRAMRAMTSSNHKLEPPPMEDQVTLTLEPHDPAYRCQCYTIKLPWLTRCPTREAPLPCRVDRFKMCEYTPQQEDDRFLRGLKLERPSPFPNKPSRERELTWGIVENTDGRFGYLHLNSFSTQTGAKNTVEEVRRLLLEELVDTDGLIFDVRNNGGGEATLADCLPQLFSAHDCSVVGMRMLNNTLNYRIFNETEWAYSNKCFKQAIDEAHGTSQTYTATGQFTEDPEANQWGQAYYKPVVVLANARSYSATDTFTCGMQDNGCALILGEDPQTGAGGANVVQHTHFCKFGPNDVFISLPTTHAMRVSWRQSIRRDKHAGQLIEDYGCSADMDISNTAEDLVSNFAPQLQKITRKLAALKETNPPMVRGENQVAEFYLPVGETPYSIFVKNTPTVRVYVDDVLQATFQTSNTPEETKITYVLPASLAPGICHRLTFVGVDQDNDVRWNLKRRFIFTPEKLLLAGDQSLKMDFSNVDTVKPWMILNTPMTPAEEGWNLEKPYLKIGNTPNYKYNLDTEMVLIADLKNKPKAALELHAEYDTEADCDFLDVIVSDNKKKKMLMSVSGKKPMAKYRFDLSEFSGKDNIVLRLKFTCDSNTTGSGVKITHLNID